MKSLRSNPIFVERKMFSNLVNKAKDVAESATESVVSIKDAGGNKVSEMVEAFKDSLPHLKGAGYELIEFEIELGNR